ncbi:MAG: NADP-dependent oxidoreductase, partial [bacterium]|nr:NADP-dependent oxidoreductase [bacterium]
IEAVLRRLTIQGFIVRDFEELRPEFEERVAGWLASGELVDRATVYEGIENAGAGLEGLLSGANLGKALVRLSE